MRSRKGRHPQPLDRSTLTSSLNDMHLTVRKACCHDRVKALKTHGLFWFEFETRWLLWSLDVRDWVCFFYLSWKLQGGLALASLKTGSWIDTSAPFWLVVNFLVQSMSRHASTWFDIYQNISKRTPLTFRDFVDHSLPKKKVNCQRTMGGSTWWNHLLRLCQNFIDVLGVQVHP